MDKLQNCVEVFHASSRRKHRPSVFAWLGIVWQAKLCSSLQQVRLDRHLKRKPLNLFVNGILS